MKTTIINFAYFLIIMNLSCNNSKIEKSNKDILMESFKHDSLIVHELKFLKKNGYNIDSDVMWFYFNSPDDEVFIESIIINKDKMPVYWMEIDRSYPDSKGKIIKRKKLNKIEQDNLKSFIQFWVTLKPQNHKNITMTQGGLTYVNNDSLIFNNIENITDELYFEIKNMFFMLPLK